MKQKIKIRNKYVAPMRNPLGPYRPKVVPSKKRRLEKRKTKHKGRLFDD